MRAIISLLGFEQDLPDRLLDAEIYEHALAVAPDFGLWIFQMLAGADVRAGRDGLSDEE